MASIKGDSATHGVPGVIGENTKGGDGVWGECDAGRGVVGVSDSGSGVWGHTKNGRGVVGVNNEEGTGVWGETKKGRGVVGIVQTDGDGTWGECNSGRGVVGVSKTGAGVWGETKKGRGVVGISETGIGVFGKGEHLAGLFEGKVEVTGSLTVNGIDVIARLAELEASRVTNFGEPIDSTVIRPKLTVRQLRREELAIDEPDEMRFFEVQGSGFLRGTSVVIRFFNTTSVALNEQDNPNIPPRHSIISNLSGEISFRGEPLHCRPGDRLKVAASDGRRDLNDRSSTLWSNSVDIVVS